MKKLWTRGLLILAAAVWLLGSLPAPEHSRVYAEAAEAARAQTMVNVNTATDQELQAIPGIGPAIAKRIVDYRAQFGNFERIDELENISGIGPMKFEKMKLQITT
jgi:comEA protein